MRYLHVPYVRRSHVWKGFELDTPDTADPELLDVVVVGAGPAGLCMTRRLAETDARFTVLERNADVGGIWDIDAPGSPMYESAHFISSKTLSGFPDLPMPEDYPDYPNHRQILAYIRSYADRFDLRSHIQFDTGVVHAALDQDGSWQLELTDGRRVHARYLVCANGVTWEPNVISWPGRFDGEIRHSVTYRDASEFAGKRVLVVGAGNSGVDIACDAAFAADQAFLSVRRGYHFIPKHIFGTPADVFAHNGPKLPHWLEVRAFGVMLRLMNGDLTRLGLPKPDHRVFESHPLMNTQILHYLGHGDCIAKPDIASFDGPEVLFVDGSRERIDLVITATGYHHASPYLDEGVLEMRNGRPDLYLGMFARNHPNLAVLGFIEFASAAYANYAAMAELIVADATAANGSTVQRRFADLKANHHPDLKGSHHYVNSERHANYVDVDAYLRTIAQVKAQVQDGVGLSMAAEPRRGAVGSILRHRSVAGR